nr:MAG TPA: hypothetical protein [Caudoviricetes sp.]
MLSFMQAMKALGVAPSDMLSMKLRPDSPHGRCYPSYGKRYPVHF